MRKRSSMPSDLNELAAKVVGELTGQKLKRRRKNPAAVALGRRGGLKGGKARAASLTPERRSEIARKAAAKRWSKAERE
jgi:hypothetical protein